MTQKFFNLLNDVFTLMTENKLKKKMDDTLLEKLLTLIQKCRLQSSMIVVEDNNNKTLCSDFFTELIKRTEALCMIEKVLPSITLKNENHSALIKSFVIRFLGLVFKSTDKTFPYEKILPLFKNKHGTIITDHIPTIQDALLFCLACVTTQLEGALWFINENLKDFVFSSFNSSSYYVRKSSVNFLVTFISHWTIYISSSDNERISEEKYLETFMKNLISFVVDHIYFYRNSEEIVFAECCITILNQLLKLENIELVMKDNLNLLKNVSDCFMELTQEPAFNKKITDIFLNIHFKFALSDEVINDVIKCLFIKEDIQLAMDLVSSYASNARSNSRADLLNEMNFFLFPVYILSNIPQMIECGNVFSTTSDEIYGIVFKKMENKKDCKILFSASLSALCKVVAQLDSNCQRRLGLEMLKIAKCSPYAQHKWLCSVLEDRLVHISLIQFYSSLLSKDVYLSLKFGNTDLVFQNIMEFLKKPTSDSNFQSQLLLLMKDVLILHKKHEFQLDETEKSDLIQILCRTLLDNRESVVDSAIQLAGEIINVTAWQGKVSMEGIHIILWDIAFQGNLDGTVRSTALRVIIQSCLETWCLNEMKSLKNITEADIATILFDFTSDPDFFLQREALSCLFLWIKSRWKELPLSYIDLLYFALVSATESLDLELKLTSLDTWMWLLENKFKYSDISPSLDVKEYAEYLATSGFGLSMILALEDYDQAVQYKAATILWKLKKELTSNGKSFDSLQVNSVTIDEPRECVTYKNLFEPISKEERDKGIDTVLEISTTEQITSICRPLSELDKCSENNFSNSSRKRACTVTAFWTCLWSDNITSILKPIKTATDVADGESLLQDIISAKVVEQDSIEDTPDCY